VAADTENRVVLGRITGVYGVRGWVRVFSYTSPLGNILDYETWWLGGPQGWESQALLDGRLQGRGVVAQLAKVVDRDQAKGLIGRDIAVPRAELPTLPEGEYYWADLTGLRVVTADGGDLGLVDHLFETGSNDVLVVRGERERLIPFLRGDVVKVVDLSRGLMVVDWDPEF